MPPSYKSCVVDNCVNPQWDMLLDLPVDDESTLKDVSIEVWDNLFLCIHKLSPPILPIMAFAFYFDILNGVWILLKNIMVKLDLIARMLFSTLL